MIPRWLPQKPAMTAGCRGSVSALRVDARQTDKILTGKQQVLMAQEQGINALEPGKVLARVLLPSS